MHPDRTPDGTVVEPSEGGGRIQSGGQRVYTQEAFRRQLAQKIGGCLVLVGPYLQLSSYDV